ncbi:MAG: hypothetical protein ABIF08_01750, partial [Nanoarchaeota archaeon]
WAVIAIIIGIIFLVFAIIWHYKNKIFKKKPKHQEQPKPKEHPKEKPKKDEAPKEIPKGVT